MMRLRPSCLKLLLCFILLQTCAAAQTGAVINGVVSDQDGAVIEGAIVEADNLESGQTASTKTDVSGKFELRGLRFSAYRVSVRKAGFAVSAKSIQLRASEIISADFLLVPGVIEDSVTVTAGKGSARLTVDTPQSVTITSASEIEARRSPSVMQALERTPNLLAIGANPLAARPRLRGLNSNRLLLVVDGERLNNVRTDPFSGISPALVDVTHLESVEVLAGAGSSLYGSDAIAGTINLVTKGPVRPEQGKYLGLRLAADAHSNGFFRRGAATIDMSNQRAALRISGTLFSLDNYRAGDEAIPFEEVLRIGNFANELGNATNNNIARTYAAWQLPASGEIPNGQGRGFYSQLDLWLFPSSRQSVRYRQLNNRHKEIGFAFLAPPYDVREQSNSFRRLDKYGLKYEGHGLKNWMSRISLGGYIQKYSFPDDNLTYSIDIGSSWALAADESNPSAALPVLTGNASTFTPANFTNGKSTTTSYGVELQATFVPFERAWLTMGLGYLRDSSVDQFARFDFSPATRQPQNLISGRATTPDSVYRNLSWSNLLEYEPFGWLRLSGGLRVDNWRTEAKVTNGFPLTTEASILEASFEGLRAQPGALDVEGAGGVLKLVDGVSNIKTSKTSVTGNLGVVLRLPGLVNPYFRWGTSYREPGVTERYLLRNFGDPTFSVLLIPNTALQPERSDNYDAGVKIQRQRWSASFGYFRNNLRDFIRSEFAPPLFVPADPERGLNPLSPFFPFHGVLYVQRANTARARIQGYEAAYEVSIPLNAAGSITPFGSLGWLKGSNLTPDENTRTLIRNYYNRSDTPVALRGSEQDAPLPGVAPFGGSFGARYSDRQGRWLGEYHVEHRARTTRVDPADLATPISTQYGSFASLSSYVKHSLHAVYNFRREKYRVVLTFGVDNLTDRLYFKPFQTAPAPGRSFIFGTTIDVFDLLRRQT
jgi:outer membrane receptor protein involved in Fe transport